MLLNLGIICLTNRGTDYKMIELKDFTTGGKYPPIQETTRLGKIDSNRKLYNNVLIPHLIPKEGEHSVKINLFRKAVDIYTNFLLSEGITIDFGNATANTEFLKRSQHLLDILYLVNTDSKRYGTGIVTIDSAGLFKVYEPDQWYQIVDTNGTLTAEVLVEYLDNPIEVPREQRNQSNFFSIVSIIINDYVLNKKIITSHKLKGGQIGEQIGKSLEVDIVGRQVVPLFTGYPKGQEGISVFDDIKDIVLDMVRIKQNLSRSLERNSSPHLAAPAGVLVENEAGNVEINTQGMLLPINKDDAKPFYLQWDTNSNAAQFQMEEHWKAYFATTSIPRMVFEPDSGGGNATSGVSIKRMMFPFVSSLAKLAESNKSLIRQLLVMYDNYLLVNGIKRLPTTEPIIEIPYSNIFIDVTESTGKPVKDNKDTDSDSEVE